MSTADAREGIRITDRIDDRDTMTITVPRREVRAWIAGQDATEAAEGAATFARVTLNSIVQDARIDPERAARKMEAAARRFLYAAKWIRRLSA